LKPLAEQLSSCYAEPIFMSSESYYADADMPLKKNQNAVVPSSSEM